MTLDKPHAVLSKEALAKKQATKTGEAVELLSTGKSYIGAANERLDNVLGNLTDQRGMVLPFEPLSVTFDKLRYAVDMPQFRPDDRGSKDHSPDEAKGKIQETTIHLRIENQGDKMNYENGTTEGTYLAEKATIMIIAYSICAP
ncbi:hypothetical protein ABKV19_008213 [Rosa sericea]